MAEFHGQLALAAEARADGRTALAAQAFRAPFHLSKPYWDAATRTLLVQVVNPTAGILSGDRLESSVAVGSGAAVLLTTPSASRVFRMRTGEARAQQQFAIEAGGWLEVLPEPLVPHRGSCFHQHTRLTVAPGGAAFYADLLHAGRVAHGEAWAWQRLVLGLEVRVGAELILRERFDQAGPALHALATLAGSGDGACFGNAVLLAPGATPTAANSSTAAKVAPAWLPAVQALHGDGVWFGVSALRGAAGWSLKWVAPDGVRLRQTLVALRRALAGTYPHLACDPRKL